MDYLAQFPTYKKLLAIFTPAELCKAEDEFQSLGFQGILLLKQMTEPLH